MGTKRASEIEASKEPKKAKKESERLQNGEPIEKNADQRADNRLPVQYQLLQLQILTQELLTQPDLVESVEKENGKDILKGLKRLHKAFGKSESSSLNHTKRLRLPSMTSQSNNPTPVPENTTLPLLPPIKDEGLKTAVFTHTGMDNSVQTSSTEKTYDRLEVLGDAYIELISTRLIWENFPGLPAGKMAQARENMVKNETLAQYATAYGFDKLLKAPADYRALEKRWIKIRGDVFEAYVAAAILSDPEGGLQAVENWLTQLWLPKLAEVKTFAFLVSEDPNSKNTTFKDQLSRKVVSKGIKLHYVDEKPPTREGGLVNYTIGVYITGWGYEKKHLGSGCGNSKAEAGAQAAVHALNNHILINELNAKKREHDLKVAASRAKEGATSSTT